MSERLLFEPFPLSQCHCAATAQELSALLGGQAGQAVALSNKTKSSNPDAQSFQSYITILTAISDSKLSTAWTNPFKSAIQYPRTDAKTEIVVTMYNYLSYLHQQIAGLDCGATATLKVIKERISDAIGVTNNMKPVCQEIGHPFFNDALCQFIDQYHRYLNAAWQLAIAKAGDKAPLFLAKMGSRCLEEARACDQMATNLEENGRSFFQPISQALVAYYTGFTRFQQGLHYQKELDFPNTIACYRSGVNIVTGADQRITFSPVCSTSIVFIRNATKQVLATAEKENQRIYMKPVPAEPPAIPPAMKLSVIEPPPQTMPSVTSPSTSYNFDIPDLPDGFDVPDIPDIPTGPPPGYQQTPPSSGGPPPPFAGGPPPPFGGPSPYEQPPSFPSVQGVYDEFADWEAVLAHKANLQARMQRLSHLPQIMTIQKDLGVADQSDRLISQYIDNYKAGKRDHQASDLHQMVQQGGGFYNSLEERVSRLEH